MFSLDDVTVIICNWMQTRFTLGAVRNVKKHYPTLKIIVVDDGSDEDLIPDFYRAYQREAYCKEERFDNNLDRLRQESEKLGFTLVEMPKHMGHGAAIDYGVDQVQTSLFLTMDNDIRIVFPGLIEEYLEKINSADDFYSVGTTYTDGKTDRSWIDPWFSLYRKDPIKELHLTFSNFVFTGTGEVPTFHIGTGAFLHAILTHEELHRPKLWRAYNYPIPENIPNLWHLKKFPTEQAGSKNYDMWHQLIDG